MARAVLAKHLCLELERVRLVSLGALLEDPLSCYGICHLNPKNNFQSIEYHHAALVDLRDAGMPGCSKSTSVRMATRLWWKTVAPKLQCRGSGMMGRFQDSHYCVKVWQCRWCRTHWRRILHVPWGWNTLQMPWRCDANGKREWVQSWGLRVQLAMFVIDSEKGLSQLKRNL